MKSFVCYTDRNFQLAAGDTGCHWGTVDTAAGMSMNLPRERSQAEQKEVKAEPTSPCAGAEKGLRSQGGGALMSPNEHPEPSAC